MIEIIIVSLALLLGAILAGLIVAVTLALWRIEDLKRRIQQSEFVGPMGPAGPQGPPGRDGVQGVPGRDGAIGSIGPKVSEKAQVFRLCGPNGLLEHEVTTHKMNVPETYTYANKIFVKTDFQTLDGSIEYRRP